MRDFIKMKEKTKGECTGKIKGVDTKKKHSKQRQSKILGEVNI